MRTTIKRFSQRAIVLAAVVAPRLLVGQVPDVDSSSAPVMYSPPTQSQRLRDYLRHTYSIGSVIEAGTRGGIDQALDRPSEWPQGGQGYADRFGSAIGQIAVRDTTKYVLGAVFREDLRIVPCAGCSFRDKLGAALKDTFTARKGEDGHTAFSVARIVGPFSGAAVAKNTWYPGGYSDGEIVRQATVSFGMSLARNVIRQLRAH
jgi:hypothetical protein